MRALAAELARASEVSGDLARSVLPALAGVEGRLDRLLRKLRGVLLRDWAFVER